MYLAYTYYLCNKITNEFYYGSRYKNIKLERTPEEDFWIYYFTSSNKVKTLIDQYGKDSFEFKILLCDKNYDICYQFEQDLIEENLKNKLCLNKYCRKTNKFSTAGMNHTDETKSKIGAKAKGRKTSDETKEKIKQSTSGKKKTPKQIENAANGRRGKKNKNPAWNKGLTNQKGHPNPNKGIKGKIKHTDEAKELIGKAHKGRKYKTEVCPHCQKEGGITSMRRWHFDKCSDNPNADTRIIGSPKQITCPHCNKTGASNLMARYHFDNCKNKPMI